MDWSTFESSPPTHCPWSWAREAWQSRDPNLGTLPSEFAKQEHGARARPCPSCATAPDALLWLCVSAPDAEWDPVTGWVAWLTLCEACSSQVDLLVDDDATQLRREGNW